MHEFEELTIQLPDGTSAYARYWAPDDLRGAVLYHHGIQSHCGWYEGSARALCHAGFAVLQMDRRGCGRNRSDRGHAESADQLIDDTLSARDQLLALSGCEHFHLMGVSWGGKLAVGQYIHAPQGVQSMMLITPGLFPIMSASREEKAKIGFAMLYDPSATFDIPLNEPGLFTTVPRWQQFFREDDLTLRQATAGFYLASRRMDRTIKKLADAPPVPTCVLLAGDERIIDNAATRGFFESLEWPHVAIKEFSDAQHSLEFLEDPTQFFRTLVSFLQNPAASMEKGPADATEREPKTRSREL